jgi:hypothetical protein
MSRANFSPLPSVIPPVHVMQRRTKHRTLTRSAKSAAVHYTTYKPETLSHSKYRVPCGFKSHCVRVSKSRRKYEGRTKARRCYLSLNTDTSRWVTNRNLGAADTHSSLLNRSPMECCSVAVSTVEVKGKRDRIARLWKANREVQCRKVSCCVSRYWG